MALAPRRAIDLTFCYVCYLDMSDANASSHTSNSRVPNINVPVALHLVFLRIRETAML